MPYDFKVWTLENQKNWIGETLNAAIE